LAAVTVGMPVYNGAVDLAGSLDCILGQTFRDIEVLVFDNASTDETPDIVARYAAIDPRVRYVRQARNKGPVVNFGDVIAAADSPYFMWRASDDRSDPNYIEALLAALEANPDKQLAVSRAVNTYEGEVVRVVDDLPGGGADALKLMFGADWTVFYGLFRRPAMAAVMARIGDRYGMSGWGFDYVALLPFFLDRSIVQTNATTFECAVRGRPRPRSEPRPKRQEVDFDSILETRARFLMIAREIMRERYPSGFKRLWAEVVVWAYANKRVYKIKRIVRRGMRRLVGLTP
jgi:glycosyltransferase involved in cell wall biosynthesis